MSQKFCVCFCLFGFNVSNILLANYIFAPGQPQPYGEFQTVSLQGWRSNTAWFIKSVSCIKYKIQSIENSWNIFTISLHETSMSNSGTNIRCETKASAYFNCVVSMCHPHIFSVAVTFTELWRGGMYLIPCGEKQSPGKIRGMVAFSYRQHGVNFKRFESFCWVPPFEGCWLERY